MFPLTAKCRNPWRRHSSSISHTDRRCDCVPDLPKEDNEENTDTDDEYHDVMSPPRQTRGPRSPTVRMLNDARLELEECISAIDARKVCRNKKANMDTEIKA